MAKRYNTGNPRPSNSMKDLNDNALAYDDFLNSNNDSFIDREGKNKDTIVGATKKMIAAGVGAVDEIRKNLIPLSKQYMSLEVAKADIDNIPDGSATYIRSEDGSSLADEYINNGGVLEPTGRRMASQDYIDVRDNAVYLSLCHAEFHNDDSEHGYAITDSSGNISFSVDIIGNTSLHYSQQDLGDYEFHNNDLDVVLAHVDQNGFISFFIDSSGGFPTANAESEFHNDDSPLSFAFSTKKGGIILGFDSNGTLINGVDRTEIEILQGEILSLQGDSKNIKREVDDLNVRTVATDKKVNDFISAGLSGYKIYSSVQDGLLSSDLYFGVAEESVVALYRNNKGIAELVFRNPDLGNLQQTAELARGSVLFNNRGAVTVRREFNSLYTSAPSSIIPDYAALIELYDGLLSEFPDSISKIEIGDSSVVGQKIYGYKITPPVLLKNSNSYAPPAPPRIIVNGCIHGHEKPAALSAFVFAQELCQRWHDDHVLETLRHEVEFIFIPGINPYGLNKSTRKNTNGVDLNRNFPYGWDSGDSNPDSVYYRGISPASEPETKAYISFLNEYDSIATLEVHNGAWYPDEAAKQIGWIGTEKKNNIFIGSIATRKWNSFAQREFNLTLNGNNSTSRLSKVADGGSSKYQINELNRASFLFELPFVIRPTNWRAIYYSVNAFSVLCNEIYNNWIIRQTVES